MEKYIISFISLFNEMAFFLLLGFAFAGLLRVGFKQSWVIKYFGRNIIKSNLLATLFGIPLPLCSCGVIPTGIALNKQGASKGASVAFLTSTPQTGVDSILVTYGFLGLALALFKVFSALVTGFIGGVIVDLFDKEKISAPLEDDKPKPPVLISKIQGFKNYLHYSFVELVYSLKNWLLIGISIAAAIDVFIPSDLTLLIGLNDNKIISYFVLLAFATPMYICATASVPIAAALVAKGFSVGAAIVFLMAGPATNAATLAVLWKHLGRKTTVIYLLNIIIGSILFAYIFDYLFPNYKITVQTSGLTVHNYFDYIKIIASFVLGSLLIFSFKKN